MRVYTYGIRENVARHTKLSQMPSLKYKEGRLELVFGGKIC